MELFEQLLEQDAPTGQAILVLWTFVMGACIGSFLNVVIYRVPLGMSVATPGSRCPRCGQPIRAWDNIPLVSWIVLRGQCRACGSPISARYPLVEFTVALLFGLLAVREFVQRGANIPWSPLVFVTPALLAVTYVYHVCLLALSVAYAWISYDGHPLPRQLVGFGLAVASIVPWVWPNVLPVPATSLALDTEWFSGGMDSLVGLVIGLACGGLVALALDEDVSQSRPRVAGAVAMWGAALGWQAIVILAGVVAILVAVVRLGRRSHGFVTALTTLAVGSFFWLLGWSHLAELIMPRYWIVAASVWLPAGVLLAAVTVRHQRQRAHGKKSKRSRKR